jgi:hypothetical protein
MMMRAKAVAVVAATSALCVGVGQAYAATEWDNGTKTSRPRDQSECIATVGAVACFVPYGDKFYVHDTRGDSRSAVAYWQAGNQSNPGARNGVCRNSHGHGTWAVCNKNLPERWPLSMWAVRYTESTSFTDWSAQFLTKTG